MNINALLLLFINLEFLKWLLNIFSLCHINFNKLGVIMIIKCNKLIAFFISGILLEFIMYVIWYKMQIHDKMFWESRSI